MSERCMTTSGAHRCSKLPGHAGPCETQEVAVRFPVGPYTDAWRGRAYLRGRLDSGHGSELDSIAVRLGTRREPAETDCQLRERLWRLSP